MLLLALILLILEFFLTPLYASSTTSSAQQILDEGSETVCNDPNPGDTPLYKLYPRYVEPLAFSNTSASHAKACLIAALSSLSDPRSRSIAWVVLGSFYQYMNQQDKAQVCFQEANKKSNVLNVETWSLLGPFQTGKTELDGDPLGAYGGIEKIVRGDDKMYYSELADQGKVGWSELPGAHKMMVTFPNIPWNKLVTSLGNRMVVVEWQAWMIGDIYLTRATNLLFHFTGAHTAKLNGERLVGDTYQANIATSRFLQPGVHTLRVRLRAKVQARFIYNITIVRPNDHLKIFHPRALPDLVDWKIFSNHLAIPVMNLHPSSPISSLRFKVVESDEIEIVEPTTPLLQSRSLGVILPGQVSYVPVAFNLISTQGLGSKQCVKPFTIELTAAYSQETLKDELATSNNISITLRCRNRTESFIFTFIDHDGTVSHAGAVDPLSPTCNPCPIMVSMHGTGVSAQDMADSYKRMDPKRNGTYIFGVKNAWTLTPARHGAHNWEGMGMRTTLRAISALVNLTKAYSELAHDQAIDGKKKVARLADSSRLIVAGHSMGGHGAWHLASHYPQHVLCALPAAGWIRKENYAESNRLFELDISRSYIDAQLRGVFESTIVENYADLYISNLAAIPIFARVGQDDQSVPPYETRRMCRLVNEANLESRLPNPENFTFLSEIPKKEHWFWDTYYANDGGVINDKDIRKFIKNYCDDSTQKLGQSQIWSLTTTNPASTGRKTGLEIVQLITPYRVARISINTEHPDRWFVTTRNVARWVFHQNDVKTSGKSLPQMLLIDGVPFSVSQLPPQGEFCRVRGTASEPNEELDADAFLYAHRNNQKWELCSLDGSQLLKFQRGPSTYGPARQVYDRPFIVIFGTHGTPETTRRYEAGARYFANMHTMASEAWVPVVRDSDLLKWNSESSNADEVANFPLASLSDWNVILIGNQRDNQVVSLLMQVIEEPFQILEEGIRLGNSNEYVGNGIGFLALLPAYNLTGNVDSLALLLHSTDEIGLENLLRLAEPTIPPMLRSPFTNMVPDFIVAGSELLWKGYGGILSAGFWNNEWRFEESFSYSIHR